MSPRSSQLLGFVALGTIAALVVQPLPAAAQAPSTAERMKEVKKACAAGDVDRGVRLLADIYAETNDATAIYNQARCYQQNAEPERAAARFREYLRKATDLSPADRAEVEGFIREADAEAAIKAQRAAQRAAQPAPAPVPAAPQPVPTAPPPGVVQPQYPQPAPTYPPAPVYAPVPPPKQPPARTGRRKGLMIAGFITLGASYILTALVGSALQDIKAEDCSNCEKVGNAFYVPILGPWLVYGNEAKGQGDTPYGTERKDLDALAAVAGVAQGVGTVLTAVGITLFATSKPKPVAVVPTFTALPGGGYGALRGSF
jgi:hypothetical protein